MSVRACRLKTAQVCARVCLGLPIVGAYNG